MFLQRLPFLLFLVFLGILQPANAQTVLSITLTVSPLSGQPPFSPSYQFSYRAAVGSVSIVIDWGDGPSNDLTYCGESCPSHTYTNPGTYTITISITDSTGATASDSNTITVESAGPTYHIQVGAWGDDASRGNTGVGVEIQTSIFPLASQDSADYFWVGDNLQNGAFIQFGYIIQTPGNYCLYGQSVSNYQTCLGSSDTVGSGDARWFWEYWPNGNVNDFYFGLGPIDSAGPDGSWHHYQIWPNVDNGWDFVLDGQPVSSFNDFKVQESKGQAYFVAEETANAPYASESLGPVEFRNLSYLSPTGWVQVQSLTALSACETLNPTLSNCDISIPYGVELLGPNDVLAGTGVETVLDGQLLWMVNPTLTLQVPSQVQVTVDGVIQEAGPIKLTIPTGMHDVSVPNFVLVNNGTALRFTGWSDGINDTNLSIDLTSDYSLSAIYVTQYMLTLSANETVVSFLTPTSGAGWYDSGSTATFSTANQNFPFVFDGWYDESGNLITSSPTGTIVMDAPHTLEARSHPNYVDLGLAASVSIVLIAVFKKRSRSKDSHSFDSNDYVWGSKLSDLCLRV
jgi:hypothetical protein